MMDFIVGMPTVLAIGTLWHLLRHNLFNALLIVTCKFSKKTILILGHIDYTIADWGIILARMLLLCK